jgi:hypothetical protein
MSDWRAFADETHTGGRSPQLRGLSAVTIAAHCRSGDGFEWINRFRRDYLPELSELKSSAVLATVDVNQRAREFLLEQTAAASIVIVDFAEHTKRFVDAILGTVGSTRDAVRTVTAFLKHGHLPKGIAETVLRYARSRTLDRSAVGYIRTLLQEAATAAGVALGDGGRLFDTEILFNLSESEFKELIVRFSVALGEALRPERHADRILKLLADRRMHNEGHIAVACLAAATEGQTVFDEGYHAPFELLLRADRKIQETIERWTYRDIRTKPDRLAQAESHLILGLQAADIAAGYAAKLFEEAHADTSTAARRVRSVFPNVLLNDSWFD